MEKLSPAAALSGTHHWMSVRTGSVRRGLLGVTVMLSTGFGIVAASTEPAAMPATPPRRRQEANNFKPVRPNRCKLINGTVLSIALSGEYWVAQYPRRRAAKPQPVVRTLFRSSVRKG